MTLITSTSFFSSSEGTTETQNKALAPGWHQDSLPEPGVCLSPQPYPLPRPHMQPSPQTNVSAPKSLYAEPRGMGLAFQIPFFSPLLIWPNPPQTSNITSYVTTSKKLLLMTTHPQLDQRLSLCLSAELSTVPTTPRHPVTICSILEFIHSPIHNFALCQHLYQVHTPAQKIA